MTTLGIATPTPLLRVSQVTKRFGAALALDDVSLDLREGEFVCLLGPSGCGKSTLLRIVAGLEAESAGRVELDGRDLAGVPAHRRPLNMMFQSYALFPHLTVAGNLAYGLRTASLTRAERQERLAEMGRLGRLEGLERRYPAQLSGGQRQRVALARALARRPRLLLLDEPLGALDRALRAETQAELKSVQRRLGTTFVTVTHDQDEAMSLSDRIGVMSAGRLVQLGTPREIYEQPADRFVAGFVGAANLLEAVLLDRDGPRGRVRVAGGEVLAAMLGAPDLMPGVACALMVRPERIHLVRPEDDAACLRAEVRETVFLGGSVQVTVALADGTPLVIRHPARAEGDGARPGARVAVAFTADDARVLR